MHTHGDESLALEVRMVVADDPLAGFDGRWVNDHGQPGNPFNDLTITGTHGLTAYGEPFELCIEGGRVLSFLRSDHAHHYASRLWKIHGDCLHAEELSSNPIDSSNSIEVYNRRQQRAQPISQT